MKIQKSVKKLYFDAFDPEKWQYAGHEKGIH
jgi:hypothetical protein